jgi:hypothetical protein
VFIVPGGVVKAVDGSGVIVKPRLDDATEIVKLLDDLAGE